MNSNNALFRKLPFLNWSFVFFITVTACIGFAMLYSAADGNFSPWASKQILRFAILFPFMIVIALINTRFWFTMAYPIYFLVLAMLVFIEFAGTSAMGATRWIRFGPFTIQPSEIMKVCVVFAVAKYFHNINSINVTKTLYIIPPALMGLIPAAFIIRQPDLGTALIILMTVGMMLFAAGVQIWKFVLAFIVVAGAIPLFIWDRMHDYQKDRVLAFLDPDKDPLGNGYNILQSKIAIGSGGLSGKGFLMGSQSQLSFLPEKQTDFIFTMLSEEFGFIGGVIIIGLYAIMIAYGVFISIGCKNHFGRMLAIGLTSILFLHVFVNIAMVMGLIPIVGAPLPLLSYGGTIMMTILVAFGLLLNIHLHSNQTLANK